MLSRRVVVVVPTYNEKDNVRQIATRLFAALPDASLLFVDDNSPDGTGRVVDELAADDVRVHVRHRAAKAGLGAAYLDGFDWALAQQFDVIVEMDADGSHAPEELPRLLDALGDADLVLGSRWVPGGRVVNWPRSRELLSRGGNAYTRRCLALPLQDATGGYRAFRADLLRQLTSVPVESQGYCFQVDMAWRAHQLGARIVEVPITFLERERGESKMSRKIVLEALRRVTVWGIRSRIARPS